MSTSGEKPGTSRSVLATCLLAASSIAAGFNRFDFKIAEAREAARSSIAIL